MDYNKNIGYLEHGVVEATGVSEFTGNHSVFINLWL